MSLAHQIVLALTANTESFCSTRVAPIPRLCSAATSQTGTWSAMPRSIPLKKFVPQTSVLESFGPGLHICFVDVLARFQPGNVLRCWYRLRRSAVLSRRGKSTHLARPLAQLRRCWRRRHAHHVRQIRWHVVFLVVAMSSTAVMALRSGEHGTQTWECIVIIHSWKCRRAGAGMMAAVGPGVRVTGAARREDWVRAQTGWRACHATAGAVDLLKRSLLGGCRQWVPLRRAAGRKSRKDFIILHRRRRRPGVLRRAGCIGQSHASHQCRRVMGKDARVAGQAVAIHEVSGAR